MSKHRIIKIAVRDFALPVPRVGSIEANSGFGRPPEDGQTVHLRVQEARAEEYPGYQAEVFVRQELTRGEYRFLITGRIDGFFEGEIPRIEEIKTGFQMEELAKKLERGNDTHPYCLQLRTYGYFYWLEHQIVPELNFHVVSTRNYSARDISVPLDLPQYEKWLALRLQELEREAQENEARSKRRKKAAKAIDFPFATPRPGQIELIETVERGLKDGKRMLLQAPTGLGKTVGVLYPTLKEALGRGQNVIYVTPKNSQHAVAEEAVTQLRENGTKVRSLTLTAKGKICFKAEPLCNPDFCEYAKDFYQKVDENDIASELSTKRKLTSKTFRTLGEKYEVCPFELQLLAAKNAETVICDYNYVFSPRASSGRIGGTTIGQEGKPSLIIDEAHNLAARGMGYFSPALSTVALERMRSDIRALDERFSAKAEKLLDAGIEAILSCRPTTGKKSEKITPPIDPFLEVDLKLRDFLSRYLESDVEIRPRDIVMRLCFYWGEFTASLAFVTGPERAEFFTSFQSLPQDGGLIKITCCDASQMLEPRYDEFEQVVGFSATLKPFHFYAKLSGLSPTTIQTAEFTSPFPKSQRKLLIIPQISTKYSERERNYPKIADAIARIAGLKKGNYFAFFPSFDFLEKVAALFHPEGFVVLKQKKEMKAADVSEVLEHLRAQESPTIVFAVQGGVFSEGVDYPGDMVVGAFVVGPPLPIFDLEREEMRQYYQAKYGSGFDYAYAYPAMAKAVQAAGRVIRSESDRGIIILMDNRFLQPAYTQSMPTDWFSTGPRELVSRKILDEISRFWDEVC